MPQMSPLSWWILFMYFILLMLMFSVMNYYIFFYSTIKKDSTQLKIKSMTWKW
uniref:ATP synthase complex subunit 8 n=1 Tax=Nepsalus insolitus TaxID=2957736 RepID=A0AAU6QFS4_9NEOP